MISKALAEEICAEFFTEEVLAVSGLGGGHINETFLVETSRGRYVLQRLQGEMDLANLEYNYHLYAALCKTSEWIYPVWEKSLAGQYFHTDRSGESWRLYPFIEGDVLEAPLSEDALFACGQGLARQHAILRGLSGKPRAVYPMLHDLKHYYEVYEGLLQSRDLCEQNRDAALEAQINERAERMLAVRPGKQAVIHGDPKLANVIFREGRVVGFLDWDTVMLGFLAEDVADGIRSCCAADGNFDHDAAMHFLEGYRSAAPAEDMEEVTAHLPDVFDKINFELGLRYYGDAISKEKRFREKDSNQLLDKARARMSTRWGENPRT